jgi:hypothetical protein
MRDVLRRIALHGGLTAIVLAIVGFMLAELATIWLAGSPGVRMSTGEPVAGTDVDDAVGARLRTRIPLLMAAWGFAFVAVGELVLHWWRGRKPVVVKPPELDPAEKLLEELLSQVESKAAAPPQEPEDTDQGTGDRSQGSGIPDHTEPPKSPAEPK